MSDCPACGAALETPLACGACGVLYSPADSPTPFETLGIAEAFDVDAEPLRKRLLELSRLVHPDFFGSKDEAQRELAEQNTAVLNAAYETLADETRRADWLVARLGGPSDSEERQMPQEFLMEVLEWNETLEAARKAEPGEGPDLDELERALRSERDGAMATVAKVLRPLPAPESEILREVRRQLNAVRYVDRALSEIKSLRLQQASTR